MMTQRVIFHVDANSAFLSWSAAYRVKVLGETEDLRDIPSVVAGDKESRHSIILAKSGPAKKFGIQTGEPLFQALEKCPTLKVVPPDYPLYVEASRHFVQMLRQFSPQVQQYSIDEAWVDMTGTERLFGSPRLAAEKMRQRINDELGFTVNIGISSNKLLAKMAGDFEKPNKVHTLFPEEMEEKMWPLPVRDLFLVGPATERKLKVYGIYTIGDLAKAELSLLRRRFGKHGETIWHFANGRNADAVTPEPQENKGYGNSITTPKDVVTTEHAHQVLLSLCETVAARMRKDDKCGRCISIHIRSNDFSHASHQAVLTGATNITSEIFEAACRVFDELWDRVTPLRQLGVQMTRLTDEPYQQYDLFSGMSPERYERKIRLDETVDALRDKFGEEIIRRAKFAGDPDGHMAGGLDKARRTGVTKPVPDEF
ncbi:MAG: DNA polymerase IV [Oscillospiraceae bacterium]|nr:DNA polymerase IV [Oscillospiraceae bacterium]MBQ9929998.1 DNA polymerase IV [Oscillospiraceae bacterium]